MSEDKNDSKSPDTTSKESRVQGGYIPEEIIKGYQPGSSNLSPNNPPQGGSGVPPKESGDKGTAEEE